MRRTTTKKQLLQETSGAESPGTTKPVVKNRGAKYQAAADQAAKDSPDQRERLRTALAALPKPASDEIMAPARDVAKLLHEASGRVFDARMVIKCILNQANSMLINYLSSSNASPLVKTAWTEEVLDFEGASKGVMDLLAALERDLCEASESAKTGGIGFLKPYFNSGVLRVEADETYAKYGAPQVRACGVMG